MPSNKAGEAAETAEKRGLAERKPHQQNTGRTQGRGTVQSALERIRQAAVRDKEQRFTSLFHHICNESLLSEAFFELRRSAAPGVDTSQAKLYTEIRWPATTHRSDCHGGQTGPTVHGEGTECYLRDGIPWILLGVSAWKKPTSGARRASRWHNRETYKLGARCRHSWILRRHRPRVAD